MRLEKIDSGSGLCKLAMAPAEWKEVYALAKFAHAGLLYDCAAPYVAQVFTYLHLVGLFGGSQPGDIMADDGMQAAFAAVNQLATETPAESAGGEIVLELNKHEMEELLTALGKASEAEDQAEFIHDTFPTKFPYTYPDLEFPCEYYTETFYTFLEALRTDQSADVKRPPGESAR